MIIIIINLAEGAIELAEVLPSVVRERLAPRLFIYHCDCHLDLLDPPTPRWESRLLISNGVGGRDCYHSYLSHFYLVNLALR